MNVGIRLDSIMETPSGMGSVEPVSSLLRVFPGPGWRTGIAADNVQRRTQSQPGDCIAASRPGGHGSVLLVCLLFGPQGKKDRGGCPICDLHAVVEHDRIAQRHGLVSKLLRRRLFKRDATDSGACRHYSWLIFISCRLSQLTTAAPLTYQKIQQQPS